jgi:hypothetical protein
MSFENACAATQTGQFDGIGFVFTFDLYRFDGYFQQQGWNKETTKAAYRGTFQYANE